MSISRAVPLVVLLLAIAVATARAGAEPAPVPPGLSRSAAEHWRLRPDPMHWFCVVDTIADMDGDGAPDHVAATFFGSTAEPGFDRVVLESGLAIVAIRGVALEPRLHVVDLDVRDRWREIVIGEQGPSDDYASRFFRFANGRFDELGAVSGTVETGLRVDGAGYVLTTCRGEVLHTWFHPCRYRLDPWTGRLEPGVTNDDVPMGTRVTLKCDLEVRSGLLKDQVVGVIRAGERAVIDRTDDRSWCHIRADSGVEGWFGIIGFSTVAGPGKPATEVFDGLCQAD